MPMAVERSKWTPDVEFQDGGVCFQKSEVVISRPDVEFQDGGVCFQKSKVVISRPRIEIFGRNLVRR